MVGKARREEGDEGEIRELWDTIAGEGYEVTNHHLVQSFF